MLDEDTRKVLNKQGAARRGLQVITQTENQPNKLKKKE